MGETIKCGTTVKTITPESESLFTMLKTAPDTEESPQVILRGLNTRLLCQASTQNLVPAPSCSLQILEYVRGLAETSGPPERTLLQEIGADTNRLVLHLDGDELFLKRCMLAYKMLEIPALGF